MTPRTDAPQQNQALEQTPSSTPPAKTSNLTIGALLTKLGPLLGLIAVVALFGIKNPREFLQYNTFQLILLQTAVIGTAALGMSMIIISGGIDLSVGSNIALVTVTIALLLNRNAPPLVAALGGIVMGGVVGFVISALVTKLRLSPFIVTLGLWGAVRGVAEGMANNNTIQAPITGLNNLLTQLGPHQQWMIFPPGVWIMIVFSIGVAMMLRYTRFGRHIFAIGSNEQTARLCGISVNPTKVAIYTIAGLLAGLAGVLQFSYLTIGDPTTATGYELYAIAAVVIGGASLNGGQGSIFGSIVGAVIMTTIAVGGNDLDLPNWVQLIVTGAIIIFAVALDQWRHRRALA